MPLRLVGYLVVVADALEPWQLPKPFGLALGAAVVARSELNNFLGSMVISWVVAVSGVHGCLRKTLLVSFSQLLAFCHTMDRALKFVSSFFFHFICSRHSSFSFEPSRHHCVFSIRRFFSNWEELNFSNRLM